MKFLTKTQTLKLLIVNELIIIIATVVAVFFAKFGGNEILQGNLIYQLFTSTIWMFIVINIALINKKFKKFAFCEISRIILQILCEIFFKKLTTYLFFGFSVSDIICILIEVLSLASIFYFYKGFSDLAVNFNEYTISKIWGKLKITYLVIKIFTIIELVLISQTEFMDLLLNMSLQSAIIFYPLFIASLLIILLGTFVIRVLTIVYIYKMIRLMENNKNTGDGSKPLKKSDF